MRNLAQKNRDPTSFASCPTWHKAFPAVWEHSCESQRLWDPEPWLKCHLLHGELGYVLLTTLIRESAALKPHPSQGAGRFRQDGELSEGGDMLVFSPETFSPTRGLGSTPLECDLHEGGAFPGYCFFRPSTQPHTQAAVSKYFSNEWNLGARRHVPPMLKWCFHCAKIEKTITPKGTACVLCKDNTNDNNKSKTST